MTVVATETERELVSAAEIQGYNEAIEAVHNKVEACIVNAFESSVFAQLEYIERKILVILTEVFTAQIGKQYGQMTPIEKSWFNSAFVGSLLSEKLDKWITYASQPRNHDAGLAVVNILYTLCKKLDHVENVTWAPYVSSMASYCQQNLRLLFHLSALFTEKDEAEEVSKILFGLTNSNFEVLRQKERQDAGEEEPAMSVKLPRLEISNLLVQAAKAGLGEIVEYITKCIFKHYVGSPKDVFELLKLVYLSEEMMPVTIRQQLRTALVTWAAERACELSSLTFKPENVLVEFAEMTKLAVPDFPEIVQVCIAGIRRSTKRLGEWVNEEIGPKRSDDEQVVVEECL